MYSQTKKKKDPTFEEEVKRLLKSMGYRQINEDVWFRDEPYAVKGHWQKIVLYHLAYAVTLETSDTKEQSKAFHEILIKNSLHS